MSTNNSVNILRGSAHSKGDFSFFIYTSRYGTIWYITHYPDLKIPLIFFVAENRILLIYHSLELLLRYYHRALNQSLQSSMQSGIQYVLLGEVFSSQNSQTLCIVDIFLHIRSSIESINYADTIILFIIHLLHISIGLTVTPLSGVNSSPHGFH